MAAARQFVAFLRGMNLGGRRITNPELCAVFEEFGCDDVFAVQASGNVVFRLVGRAAGLERRLATHLGACLDYDVPTFVRSADRVRAIAATKPFGERDLGKRGKTQVALLARAPAAKARREALAFASDDDWLEIVDAELFWSPRGRLTESELDMKGVERALGSMTVRTMGTLERIAGKCGE